MSKETADGRTSATDGRGEEPLYNIGVVTRMTGVPVATIRVWERRYGFPDAARTSGGHRIYTDREVARLRWVKARIDEGMQASKAVRALQVAEDQGRFPEPPAIDAPAKASMPGGAALDAATSRLTAALLAHDASLADQILGEALALHPVEDLVLGVLRPMLVAVGQGWADGGVSVATEHFASQFARQRMLAWLTTGPTSRPVRPVVLACAPGEWHDTSLLMLAVLLRRRRWPVAYLGQAVPLPDLADFVASTRPSAVVVVAMTEPMAEGMLGWPAFMPEAAESGRPPVCFGGRVYSREATWRERMPGRYLGDTIPDGAEVLERLLVSVTGMS